MTDDRALKQAIRRRMEQTGEKYTDARRAVLIQSVHAKHVAARRIWEAPAARVEIDGTAILRAGKDAADASPV